MTNSGVFALNGDKPKTRQGRACYLRKRYNAYIVFLFAASTKSRVLLRQANSPPVKDVGETGEMADSGGGGKQYEA